MTRKNNDNLNILVVDDDPGQRSLFESFLTGEGFNITSVDSPLKAFDIIDDVAPLIILSDVRMPDMTGLEFQQELRKREITIPVLLITAYADIREAVGAIRDGAVDYLEKPVDLNEMLRLIRRTLGIDDTEKQINVDIPELPDNVVAGSSSMQDVLREIALVAPSGSRVLITGESGTGKEVVSDLIHLWSERRDKKIVKVNCAAIPENLLESELFGHEKGAFTGAESRRIGRFEEADGGTLMLDEIGEMSPVLQAKVLRFIQDGSFYRVGSNVEKKVDVRILAATNRDLEKEVAEGHFREDLFYRLNVFDIYLPPLRERRADILPLALSFAVELGYGKARFSPGAVAMLENAPWPGNIRELRNAVERAVLLSRGEIILPEHLPRRMQQSAESLQAATPESSGSHEKMEDIERDAILKALRENDGNRSETARGLGISRRKLIYKLQTYREQGFVIEGDE